MPARDSGDPADGGPNPDRRDVLAGGASAIAAALAGCAGGFSPGSAGSPTAEAGPDGTEGDEPATTDGPTGAGTATTAAGDGIADGLVLPSVDVGSSPGDLVELRPSGTAVVLDFFATWCPPCEPEMDNLRAVRERFDPAEVFVVSVTQETDEAAIETFWEENRGTWPVTTDPGARAMRRYDVTTIPTIVVLAPDGTETGRHTGLVGEETLVEAVEGALREDST